MFYVENVNINRKWVTFSKQFVFLCISIFERLFAYMKKIYKKIEIAIEKMHLTVSHSIEYYLN